jgi:hypothetical protein
LNVVSSIRTNAFLPTAAYVRQARRLRATYTAQPGRLHAALRNLSPAAEPAPGAADDSIAQFAKGVGALLSRENGLLRYSARLELLRVAQRMGIERFAANLIIAAVQQRIRPRPVVRVRRAAVAASGGWSVGAMALAAVAIEGLVLLTAWWIHR